jgi:hypothetical protein
MKIKFSGLRRSLYDHRRDVHPVRRDAAHAFSSIPMVATQQWTDESTAFEKFKDLQFHGDFLVEISFSDRELINWLMAYLEIYLEKAALLVETVRIPIFSGIIASAEKLSMGSE